MRLTPSFKLNGTTGSFIDKYTIHGPDVFLLDSGHLHDRDGYDIIDDAISLYGFLLGLVKKFNKYQILTRYEHSPFGNKIFRL